MPWLTVVIAAVTLASSVASIADEAILGHLRRSADRFGDGEVWRLATSLFAQDGGVAGTVSNVIFLIGLGVLAEWGGSRRDWLIAYFGAGIGTQLVGMAGWQPVGAGNSVANCGLAALLTVRMWRGMPVELPAAPIAVGLWVTALLGEAFLNGSALVIACALICAVIPRLAGWGPRLICVFAAITAIVLCFDTNIHGAALVIGMVIAACLAFGRQELTRSPPVDSR